MTELALRVWTRDEIQDLAQRMQDDIRRPHGSCGFCGTCRLANAGMATAIAAARGRAGRSHRRATAGPD